jgi:uncharacterized protein involved in exopolysaccharide biosynthesis
MNENRFDLIGIFREIFKRKVFIILLTAAAILVSLIFCLMQQKRYTSETIFIVKNPLLIDRNYVFRNTSYEHKEFFAIADDVDHVGTIGKSDELLWFVIGKFDLAKAYNIENPDKLLKKVKGNFKLTHEDTKNIELFYTDPDPKRAAAITEAARNFIEEQFLNYFLSTNKDITDALQQKSLAVRDTIARLDDSISSIRARTGNYSQLLPARGNTINTAGQAASAEGAAGMEQLQEIAAIKDRLVNDLASYRSLMNEYEIMASGKIRIFYVVQPAYEPLIPSHPKTLIIVAASALGAIFFACIIVLFGAFYRNVMADRSAQKA